MTSPRAETTELVIFDCDGVLLDSEVIACSADAEALTRAGYEITTAEIVERFAGVPADAMYAAVEADLGRPLPATFRADVKRSVLERYRSELRAIDGAAEVLSSMKTRKCVASSSAPAKLALGLVEADLFELLYPGIFSTALVSRGKPHPDLFEYAARAMAVGSERCLVVEDSVAGVTAAMAAGMRCIGFTGGAHCAKDHRERLTAAGATTVISDLRQLMTFVE